MSIFTRLEPLPGRNSQLRHNRTFFPLKHQWPFLVKHRIVSERTINADESFGELCYNEDRRTGVSVRYGDAH